MASNRRFVVVALLLPLAVSCSVSDRQEVAIGQQNAEQINAQLPLVTDPAIVGYVSQLGKSIAGTTSRADLDWHFYVVNTNDVNAFALPGGFVYVNRGLIERTQRLDQLAGAIGHEIGHVVLRHGVDQLKKQTGANLGLTVLCTLTSICQSQASRVVIDVAGSALFARYSRLDEAEADSEAVVNVVHTGIDPQGIPELFRILIAERQRDPSAVDEFFASHPLEESRVVHTERLIQQYDPASLRRLTVDDPSYHAFQRALAALPPAPKPRQMPQPTP